MTQNAKDLTTTILLVLLGFASQQAYAGGKTPTTTALSLSSGNVTAGTAVTFTATVSPSELGQVLFCNASAARCDGAALLATAQLTSASTASIKLILGIGSYSIKAVFVGTKSVNASTSTAHTLTVTGPAYASTTTIDSSGSPGDYTLTSKVTGFGLGAPAGTISFLNTTSNNTLVATAELDPLTHSSIFLPSADSPISGQPAVQFVATGDFNNDGKPDFAVLNVEYSGTVAVYLGKGDGTFGSPTSYEVGRNPQAIAVADINQDGKLDLLVVNLDDYTVSILLGNGDGTFQPQTTTGTDCYPIFIAVGDFNNDGIPDIATANWDCYDISIHLGVGDGTFQPEERYSATEPYGVVIGDFNQDGIQDIAISAGTNDYIEILLGVGDGSFASAQQIDLPKSAYAYWMAGGDLRNNGKSDLVVADDSSAEVYVLLSNGDGTFQPAASYATAGPAEGVSLGDINGDGILDIVVPDFGGDVVSILLGNGDGTFAARTDYNVGTAPSWAALADLNGDGALDLVTSDTTSLTATILLQAQTATATATGVAVYGTGTQLVKASFPGDTERVASQSSTIPLTGSPQTSTSTNLTAAPNPAAVGQSVTLTATVSPVPHGSPLGTVHFFDGETALGSGNVDSSGIATFSISNLATGAHSLTAVYSGNAGFTGSTSKTFTETVSATLTGTVTTLAAAPNPDVVGQAVALTATVSPTPTGSSLGAVSFYDGETLLGKGNVNSSGVATFSTTSLALGAHSLTAVYSGDSGFTGSTSNTVTQIISKPISTTTTLSVTPDPVDDGQMATLTATVSPAPTGSSPGTVSFFNGSSLLGMGTVNSSGVATFSTTKLSTAALSLTAVYSGNSGFTASTSTPFVETVDPGYTVTAPPTPVAVAEGGTVAIKVTVPPLGGAFNRPVTLSASGLPPGATASFNPATVTPGASGAPTVMTIQLAKLAASISGKDRKSPAGQFVFATFFLAACCLSGLRRKRWPTQFRLIAFFAILVFAGMTTVGCSGGFLSPPTTHPGQYVVTITGTSGSVRASTTVTVVVR
jgi:hypothetical protein